MKSISKNISILNLSAKTWSYLFHPLLMPLYGLLIILSRSDILKPNVEYFFSYYTSLIQIVVVYTFLIPVSLIPLYYLAQVIKSIELTERQHRFIPFFITSMIYVYFAFYIYGFPIFMYIKIFFIATAAVSFLIAIITLWWKISAHSAGAGGITALAFFLLKMNTSSLLIAAFVLIFSGITMTARLYLKAHTQRQVYIGFLLGFVVMLFFLYFKF